MTVIRGSNFPSLINKKLSKLEEVFSQEIDTSQ